MGKGVDSATGGERSNATRSRRRDEGPKEEEKKTKKEGEQTITGATGEGAAQKAGGDLEAIIQLLDKFNEGTRHMKKK